MLLAKDKIGIGRRVVALLSILFLVPAIRKLREQRHQKPRRHFPLFGH
jgi:hypothetical protein